MCLHGLNIALNPRCLHWLNTALNPRCLHGLNTALNPRCLHRLNTALNLRCLHGLNTALNLRCLHGLNTALNVVDLKRNSLPTKSIIYTYFKSNEMRCCKLLAMRPVNGLHGPCVVSTWSISTALSKCTHMHRMKGFLKLYMYNVVHFGTHIHCSTCCCDYLLNNHFLHHHQPPPCTHILLVSCHICLHTHLSR